MIPNGGRLCNFENMESSLHHIRQSLGTKYMAFTCMSWKGRALYHAYRRRKKPTWNSTPYYKAEKETVTGEMVVKAIMTTLGPRMKAAGVK